MDEPSLFGIVQKLNIESNYFLAIMIIVSLFIITFIAMKNYDTKITFMVVSYLTIIVGGGFYGLGLLPQTFLLCFIGLFVISMLTYLIWNKT